MPRNKKTNATQVQTTAIVPRLRNCSDRNGCDAAAPDAGDFSGTRVTRETGAEGTRGGEGRIFFSAGGGVRGRLCGSGPVVGFAEGFSGRAGPGLRAKLLVPV